MKQLTRDQRYKIEAYLKLGTFKEFIAKDLGIHRSTVYREMQCKSGKTDVFLANRDDIYEMTDYKLNI